MPVCNCGAYIRKGVQCSQCELEEYGDIYRNQCPQCGTTGVDDGLCADCSERTSQEGEA